MGANINAKDKFGNTPLMTAVMAGSYSNVKFLLSSEEDLLLPDKKVADVNSINSRGNTALMLIAESNCKAKDARLIAEELLNSGADINAVQEDGLTPLMLAAYSANLEIVNLLLVRGANPNLKNVIGNTALEIAIHNSSFERSSLAYDIQDRFQKIIELIQSQQIVDLISADSGFPSTSVQSPGGEGVNDGERESKIPCTR